MQTRKSVVLSRSEAIEMLSPKVIARIQAKSADFVRGDSHTRSIFSDFYNIPQCTEDQLVVKWCELCSEDFFTANPAIDDVLLKFHDDIAEKVWMCSKDDWENPPRRA